jgi:sugar/nucleoside kinase (ribokinase family)
MFDIITVGGATMDTFVESDSAKIMNIETQTSKQSYLCFDYGAKMEMDQLAYDIGGGATNAAVNFANLGLKTSTIIKIGEGFNSQAVLKRLKDKGIDHSMVIRTGEYRTGFSIILTSFEGDRTVLMHRGANSDMKLEDINFEKIKNTKWIYFASLSGDSNQILDKVAEFAEKNNINMAFNPGIRQIKRGLEDLKKILETAEVLIMNRNEAAEVTGIPSKPEDIPGIDDQNLFEIIVKLKSYGSKVVVITEGKRGVYAFDGDIMFYNPPFPSKVVSTLGAGDAFSSTFVAGIIKTNWDIEKSLKMASVNSAAVIQSFGAQHGLKNFEEIKNILENNPNYKVQKKESGIV